MQGDSIRTPKMQMIRSVYEGEDDLGAICCSVYGADSDMAKANARRIVDCVNAMKGVDDPTDVVWSLQRMTYAAKKMIEQLESIAEGIGGLDREIGDEILNAYKALDVETHAAMELVDGVRDTETIKQLQRMIELLKQEGVASLNTLATINGAEEWMHYGRPRYRGESEDWIRSMRSCFGDERRIRETSEVTGAKIVWVIKPEKTEASPSNSGL